MNCSQFQERISSAVDHCLPAEEQQEFDRHAEQCPRCRHDFGQEISTKVVICRRAHMVDVPPHLQRSILAAIEHEAAEDTSRGRQRSTLFRWNVLTAPAIAVALGTLLVALLVTRDSAHTDTSIPFNTAGLGAHDVLGESLRNFHRVLTGDIAPQMKSGNPDDLYRFFRGRTEFPVVVPTVPAWKLVGGVLDDFGGAAVAHLVYENNGDVVCVSQVCWETVRAGKALQLSSEITAALMSSGRFALRGGDGDAVVLWTRGGGLCIAVAHMDRDTLLTVLLGPEITEEPLP